MVFVGKFDCTPVCYQSTINLCRLDLRQRIARNVSALWCDIGWHRDCGVSSPVTMTCNAGRLTIGFCLNGWGDLVVTPRIMLVSPHTRWATRRADIYARSHFYSPLLFIWSKIFTQFLLEILHHPTSIDTELISHGLSSSHNYWINIIVCQTRSSSLWLTWIRSPFSHSWLLSWLYYPSPWLSPVYHIVTPPIYWQTGKCCLVMRKPATQTYCIIEHAHKYCSSWGKTSLQVRWS